MFEKHQHKEQFPEDLSRKQESNRFSEESQNYATTWTKQRSSNSSRILQHFNVLIAMPFQKSGSFVAFAGEIWSTSGVLQQPRRLIATLLRSLALSLRRIQSRTKAQRIWKTDHVFQGEGDAGQPKHGGHPTILARWYAQIGHRESLAEHDVGEKEVMLFDRITLERHDHKATRAERLQNAKHWTLRLDSDGHQKPLWQRPEFVDALKQCLNIQDAHLAETQESLRPFGPEHQKRQRRSQLFEGGENFDYYDDRKTGWRYSREPRWNPQAASSSSTSQWPTSQWQRSWNSWQPTPSEKWWWFRFAGKNSRKSTVGVEQDTHSQYTSVQYSLFTSAERTSRAWLKADQAQVTRIAVSSLCAWEEAVIWFDSCLILVGRWLTCRLPRAHHLPHSLFFLPRHKNTQHNRYNMIISENTQYITHISTLSQSTSSAIKNHSGVKTCRVAVSAHDSSHRLSAPTACDCLKDRSLFWRSISITWCTGKSWRRRLPSCCHRRSEGIWRIWDLAYRIPKYQRRLTSNRRCISTIPWEALQILISKMESYKRCWHFSTVCPESFGETRCNGRAGERGKCTTHSCRSKGKFEVSFIWRSESSGETQCIVFIWAGKLDWEFSVQKR